MGNSNCSHDTELLAWLQDRAGKQEQLLTSHLDACPFCQKSLERLDKDWERRTTVVDGDNLWQDLRRQPPPDSLEAEPECANAARRAASACLLAGDGQVTRPQQALETEALRHLGNYEILGVLGRGGMGVVYKARQRKANRIVALKMILTIRHASVQDQVRFQIEAEAVAYLQHPNIVQLHEVGEHDGMSFFSLEFCEGGSLDAKLKTWRPSGADAAALAETLARAMHHAHLRGVVHRDLKPANILLASDGTPKIADFGLAKRLESGSDISRTGAIMGTPSYMAPEQAEGRVRDIGPAADVYALGAVLYELLAGRPPFRGETAFDTVRQVIADEPAPPSGIRPGVPRDLETICLKCLRKQPGQRYASAEALAEDLHRYRQGEPIRARAAGTVERVVKWARRRPLPAAVLLLAVLGGASIVWASIDAEQQRRIAEHRRKDAEAKEQLALHEAARAKKAREFLVGIFELSDPNNPRGTQNARQILDDAEQRIPEEFADQPELRAELIEAIESVYTKLTANAPLAMILEVRGNAWLRSTADASQAVPETLLYSGNRLSLAADAQVQLVFLSDLHTEWLDPGREATVRRKGCEPADAVRARDQDTLMTFVRLPKGTFYMGGGGGNAGTKTEIKEDFEISVHLVTQGQWQQVMGNNPSSFSRFGPDYDRVKGISDEELKLFPVECVSVEDAQKFIEKLNERNRGRGCSYRLPTESEWEYACRAGATTAEECSYHFYFRTPTNAISSADANFDGRLPFGEAPKGHCLERLTRVGSYPPNGLGLCDMQGNLSQWCSDSEGHRQVHRGGAWGSDGFHCRAAERNVTDRWDRSRAIGLRLVRVAYR